MHTCSATCILHKKGKMIFFNIYVISLYFYFCDLVSRESIFCYNYVTFVSLPLLVHSLYIVSPHPLKIIIWASLSYKF